MNKLTLAISIALTSTFVYAADNTSTVTGLFSEQDEVTINQTSADDASGNDVAIDLTSTYSNWIDVTQEGDSFNTVSVSIIDSSENDIDVYQEGSDNFAGILLDGANNNTIDLSQTGLLNQVIGLVFPADTDLNHVEVAQNGESNITEFTVIGSDNNSTVHNVTGDNNYTETQFLDERSYRNSHTVTVSGNNNFVSGIFDASNTNSVTTTTYGSDNSITTGVYFSDENTINVNQTGVFSATDIMLDTGSNNNFINVMQGNEDTTSMTLTGSAGNIVNISQN